MIIINESSAKKDFHDYMRKRKNWRKLPASETYSSSSTISRALITFYVIDADIIRADMSLGIDLSNLSRNNYNNIKPHVDAIMHTGSLLFERRGYKPDIRADNWINLYVKAFANIFSSLMNDCMIDAKEWHEYCDKDLKERGLLHKTRKPGFMGV